MIFHSSRLAAAVVLALSLPSHVAACISLERDPAEPNTILSINQAEALFEIDDAPHPIQVGQRIEYRLPLAKAGESWKASIASPDVAAVFRLEQTPARSDEDGIMRTGLVFEGLGKGAAIVVIEYLTPPGKSAKGRSIAAGRRLKMLYFDVRPRERWVVPHVEPLSLTEADSARPQHVTTAQDIRVTLAAPALPEGMAGAWRIAAGTGTQPVVRSRESMADKSELFVLGSASIAQPLVFEFVAAPVSGSGEAPKVVRSVAFNIEVRPAPAC
ncbi:hypothetical protein [Herbaspirillum sp.]|uniref:hypothetical protein n=1 Tax=Herbaspirillum sp. TaxID=1890675 RepID=UPI001B0C4AD0|nr:hypothetical protein [Herbaspirillum sp.]MBO9538069.1 hypothetical protein [Herbaspirillum sp.]